MPQDLLFCNAILENNDSPVDIAIHEGVVSNIGPHLPAQGSRVVDVSGMLASPLFIDPHHHLDCAFLSEPPNLSGTLDEAIQINARLKVSRSDDDTYENACRALRMALQNGTGWLRSHTDIDSVSRLKLLYPILKARHQFRGMVDVQIVAFPQLGLIADPQSVQLMRSAMREGADVVGGMPHAELSPEDFLLAILSSSSSWQKSLTPTSTCMLMRLTIRVRAPSSCLPMPRFDTLTWGG